MKLGTVLVVAAGLTLCFVGGGRWAQGHGWHGILDVVVGAGLVFLRIYETRPK